MKIVHVITRMIVGGAQENTLLSAEGQARIEGNEVLLITGSETGTEGDLLAGYDGPVRVVHMPELMRAVHPVLDVKATIALRRIFREERPDVVHTHSSKAGVVGRVAAKAARVPLVFHTLHSLVFHDYQPWYLNRSLRIVKRGMVPFTDHYASVSDNIRVRALAAGIGKPEQHSTVYSGFQTDAFIEALLPRDEAKAALGLPTDRFVVGVVGRLFELKGHDQILRAAPLLVREAPETLFAFVGSGPLEDELRREISRLGLDDHFTFTGRLPFSEMPVAFSAFDALAHASLREGLARVIPQAVLAGAPVVCYDLDGSSEVVHDEVNGYLVPPLDHRALADRLALLAHDPELRTRLGGATRDDVAHRFSATTMATHLDRLYRDLLAARVDR